MKTRSINTSYSSPLHYPKVEYDIDGKRYQKLLSRGWSSPWYQGDPFTVEYMEGLPESAESELYPGLRTRISNLETFLIISIVLFLVPFFLRWFMKWNVRYFRRKETMEEYRGKDSTRNF